MPRISDEGGRMKTIFETFGEYIFFIGICLLSENIFRFFSLRKEKKINSTKKIYNTKEMVIAIVKLILPIICLVGWGKYNLSKSNLSQLFLKGWQVLLPVLPVMVSCAVISILYSKKRKKHDEKTESEYVIKTESFLFVLFLVFSVVCAGVTIYAIVVREALWIIIFFVLLLLVMGYAALNVGLWKIVVRNDEIEYTSTFGIKKKYNFKQIEKAVFKKSGALRIYSKEKRIFTFDDNMDFSRFIKSLEDHYIPIWHYSEYQRFKAKKKR